MYKVIFCDIFKDLSPKKKIKRPLGLPSNTSQSQAGPISPLTCIHLNSLHLLDTDTHSWLFNPSSRSVWQSARLLGARRSATLGTRRPVAIGEWRGEEARRCPASSGSRRTRGQAKRKAIAAQPAAEHWAATERRRSCLTAGRLRAHSIGYLLLKFSSWLLAFLNLEFLVANIGSKNQRHNVAVSQWYCYWFAKWRTKSNIKIFCKFFISYRFDSCII